jgi:hypothetical protein
MSLTASSSGAAQSARDAQARAAQAADVELCGQLAGCVTLEEVAAHYKRYKMDYDSACALCALHFVAGEWCRGSALCALHFHVRCRGVMFGSGA